MTLPAVAVDQAASPYATRTLVLAARSGVAGYRLVGAEVGDAAVTLPVPDAEPMVAQVTQTLLDTSGDVQATGATDALRRLGIGFVVVAVPVPAAVEQQLDITSGLTRLGQSGGYALWRVEPTVTSKQGQPQPPSPRPAASAPAVGCSRPCPSPARTRTSTQPCPPVRRDGWWSSPSRPARRWQATLNDLPLTPENRAGLQAFQLPPGGGHLVVRSVDDRHRLLLVQGIGLVMIVLLALPIGRRRRDDEVGRMRAVIRTAVVVALGAALVVGAIQLPGRHLTVAGAGSGVPAAAAETPAARALTRSAVVCPGPESVGVKRIDASSAAAPTSVLAAAPPADVVAECPGGPARDAETPA